MITLKTLEQATAQEVFDQVALHLLTQGERSINEEGNCAYRGRMGLKCAGGCLIGDDEYDERMENKSWNSGRMAEFGVPKAHKQLILSLQVIHDNHFKTLKELTKTLKTFAFNQRLSARVVDNFPIPE